MQDKIQTLYIKIIQSAGGAVISALHATAAIPFGVSGVVLLLAMSDWHSTIFYFIGLLTAATAGFIATWRVGFDDPTK